MGEQKQRRRLVVVFNPRSSKFLRVDTEVLVKTRELKGWTVAKYEVRPTEVMDNVHRLAKILEDGDLVVSAGGDGTATIAFNGVVESGKEVELGILGYGNFNDFARTLKTKNLEQILEAYAENYYGLELWVDGTLERRAACYLTMGLFAESAKIFDNKSEREWLKKGKASLLFSLWTLFRWYRKNHKRDFLPKMRKNEESLKRLTDYWAVNSQTMGRIMRGGDYTRSQKFLSGAGNLGNWRGIISFMLRSVLIRLPGKEREKDEIEFCFKKEQKVLVQMEGEYFEIEGKKLLIRKTQRPIRVKRI